MKEKFKEKRGNVNSLYEEVVDLNKNVEKMTESLRTTRRRNRWISYIVVAAMLAMLVLVPILAIQGNAGGAAVLGVMFLIWIAIMGILKAIVIIWVATLDAKAQEVTHKASNLLERLGEKKN